MSLFNMFRRSERSADAVVVAPVSSDAEITAPLEMPVSIPSDTIVVDASAYVPDDASTRRLAMGSDGLPAPLRDRTD